jgi:hypothetical protein
MRLYTWVIYAAAISLVELSLAKAEKPEPVCPQNATIRLFNGKNLDGLYTWLQDTKYADPRKVFTVDDGMIHISGDGFGYVATKQRYKDYHLVVEYRWGDRTWLERKTCAKDSGIIFHCIEPDGCSHDHRFMGGFEAQICEGCTGDFFVLDGKAADGSYTPASLTAETVKNIKGQPIWKKGGERIAFSSIACIQWFGKDPDWKEVTGFRGKNDLDSPGHEWTRLDVICDGGHIVYLVNGVQANEGFDAKPSSGRILIQCEGAEIFIRRWELQPLGGKMKE